MSNDLDLYVRIAADTARYNAGLGAANRTTGDFVERTKSQLSKLKDAFGSLEGQLAALGVSLSMAMAIRDAALLDKSMGLLKNSVGASKAEIAGMRQEMYANQQATGVLVDEQKRAADALAAGGMSIDKIRATLTPMSEVMAVAKTDADQLAKALSVTGTHFGFDLSNAKVVTDVLDKMYQAGKAGFAELENLPDIFARVGTNAKAANLSFEETLATIETLSKFEAQPERLATLVDSTLRVFTNAKYMKDASKATGVQFFDSKGMRRNALDVLHDIEARYRKLQTDAQRSQFVAKAFGQSDQTTVTGLMNLLSSGSLASLHRILGDIKSAPGAVKADLPDSLNNAVTAATRLKGVMSEAADEFTKPLRDTFANMTSFLLDSREKGGMGMTGKEIGISALTIGGLMAAFPLARVLAGGKGGKADAIGGAIGGVANLAGGLATGKVLQETAGVTPVYVVNMPGDGMAGGAVDAAATAAAAGAATSLGSKLKTGVAMALGMPKGELLKLIATGPTAQLAAAGAAGYGIGTGIYKVAEGTPVGDALIDKVGGGIAKVLAFFGNENAAQAVAITEKLQQTEIKGTVSVTVQTAPGVQASVTSQPANRNTTLPVGRTMDGVR